MSKSFIFSLFVLCSLSIIACKSSVEEEPEGEEITEVKKETATASQLQGKWDVVEVYRSGAKQDLNDFYITFKEGSILESNIPSKEGPVLAGGVGYELKGNAIYNEASEDVFNITEISDSFLVINAHIYKFDFEMTFKKVE